MNQKSKCPICNSENQEHLLDSDVPVLQNRVYNTYSEAKQSLKGHVRLTFCRDCSFCYNSTFDESIVIYDENYENSVPSSLFHQYYMDIAHYLHLKYSLDGKVVYDIGCGKGTFLDILTSLYPEVKGVGIDPSYEGEMNPKPNLTFIKEFFTAKQVEVAPDLILSRHVFEHIEYPGNFFDIIYQAISRFENIPFFFEVPDFKWITDNKAFWDICYEHCNYYNPNVLRRLFNTKTSEVTSIASAFGNQYLWIEGLINHIQTMESFNSNTELTLEEVRQFTESIENNKKTSLKIIQNYRDDGYSIIIWGMATKGVIYSNLLDPKGTIVDFCVDINIAKQNKFIPLTGQKILAPSNLSGLVNDKSLIVVMNTNYVNEIKDESKGILNHCVYIDAHGNEI